MEEAIPKASLKFEFIYCDSFVLILKDMVLKKSFGAAALSVLISCSSPPEPTMEATPVYEKLGVYKESPNGSGQYNDFDLGQLKSELSFSTVGPLGYKEVSFNSCSVKANHSLDPRCAPMFFSRLHLELYCRRTNAQGHFLTSVPLGAKVLGWRAGGRRGAFKTNSQGEADFVWVSNSRSSYQMMRMNLGPHVLKKRLKDNWKIILPESWCEN